MFLRNVLLSLYKYTTSQSESQKLEDSIISTTPLQSQIHTQDTHKPSPKPTSSTDKFTKEHSSPEEAISLFDCPFMANSPICRFVNENISNILNGILEVINVRNISQTNLSCLNTVIIIFIMAKHLGKMQMVVDMLKSKETRQNFKDLLERWNLSYSYRPKDSDSLQFTTKIDFNEFLNIDLLSYL